MGQLKSDEVTESVALQNVREDTGALLETITAYITNLNTAPLIAGSAHEVRVRAARVLQSSVHDLKADIKVVIEAYALMMSMLSSVAEKLRYETYGRVVAEEFLRSKEIYEKRYTEHVRSYLI